MRPASLAQWIIAHDGLPAYTCAEIAALAARPVDFVEIGASTGNYDAKNDAFRRDVFVQFRSEPLDDNPYAGQGGVLRAAGRDRARTHRSMPCDPLPGDRA
ncbi:hypothetical protein ACUBUD_01330 [Burkholderia metallica]